MNPSQLRLYLVTDSGLTAGRDLADIVMQAVAGGATMVQLREKHGTTRQFVDLAVRLKGLLAPKGVPLIINDRLDVALAADADGLHIGQTDMPYPIARRLLGKDKIIGLSVENIEQVRQANDMDVDYIGVSPVFDTATKTDTARAFGIEGLRQAAAISRHPAVAIGGMNLDTAGHAMRAGAAGIAVVSAIVAAADPRQAAQRLIDMIDNV